jgi:hypothetical protein
MAKKVLQCEYCRHIITENDSKCPNCGANCVNVIKKYKAEQEAEANARKEELSKQASDAAKAVGVGFGVFSIIPIVIFIIVIIFIGVGISQMNKSSSPKQKTSEEYKQEVEEQINEIIKKDDYTITIESYELYEYYDKNFTSCNTKDGYQRIAFHFVIENNGEKSLATTWMVHNITVKADSEVVKESSIHANDHFCSVKKGKKDYADLTGSTLLAKDKESGYKGYEVPTNAEKLKFIFDEDHVIEIDNPAYKKNE